MNELQRLQSRVACFAALAFFGVVLMLLGFAHPGSDLFDEMTGGLLAVVSLVVMALSIPSLRRALAGPPAPPPTKMQQALQRMSGPAGKAILTIVAGIERLLSPVSDAIFNAILRLLKPLIPAQSPRTFHAMPQPGPAPRILNEWEQETQTLCQELTKLLVTFPARKYALWLLWLEDLPCSVLARQLSRWSKFNTDIELQDSVHYLLFGKGYALEPESSLPLIRDQWANWESGWWVDLPDDLANLAAEMKHRNDCGANLAATWSYWEKTGERNKCQMADCYVSVEAVALLAHFDKPRSHYPSLDFDQANLRWMKRAEEILQLIHQAPGEICREDTIGPPIPKAVIEEVCREREFFNLAYLERICALAGVSWSDYPWSSAAQPLGPVTYSIEAVLNSGNAALRSRTLS